MFSSGENGYNLIWNNPNADPEYVIKALGKMLIQSSL
jgi:hypothetical protein